MNKVLKILVAIFGGIEVVFTMALPILVAIIWVRISEVIGISAYILISAGLIASLFRAIKIGFIE